jgi:hypothetical protein
MTKPDESCPGQNTDSSFSMLIESRCYSWSQLCLRSFQVSLGPFERGMRSASDLVVGHETSLIIPHSSVIDRCARWAFFILLF